MVHQGGQSLSVSVGGRENKPIAQKFVCLINHSSPESTATDVCLSFDLRFHRLTHLSFC